MVERSFKGPSAGELIVLDSDPCGYTISDPDTAYVLVLSHIRGDEYVADICESSTLNQATDTGFAPALEAIAAPTTGPPEQPAVAAPAASDGRAWIIPMAIAAGAAAFAAAALTTLVVRGRSSRPR